MCFEYLIQIYIYLCCEYFKYISSPFLFLLKKIVIYLYSSDGSKSCPCSHSKTKNLHSKLITKDHSIVNTKLIRLPKS